jgi:beta-galactosidase
MNKGEYPRAMPDDFNVFTNAESVRLYRGDRLIKEFPALNAAFPHLPHPPIVLDDFLGDSLESKEELSPKNAVRIKTILQSINRTGPGQIALINYLRMLLVMISARRSARSLTALITQCVMSWGSESLAWRIEAIRDGKTAAAVEIGEQVAAGLAVETDTLELVEGDTYDVASIRFRAVDTHGNLLPLFMEPVTLAVEGSLELIGPASTALRGGLGGTYVRSCGQTGPGRLTLQCGGLPAVVLDFNIHA